MNTKKVLASALLICSPLSLVLAALAAPKMTLVLGGLVGLFLLTPVLLLIPLLFGVLVGIPTALGLAA
jgi:hypothetical protein